MKTKLLLMFMFFDYLASQTNLVPNGNFKLDILLTTRQMVQIFCGLVFQSSSAQNGKLGTKNANYKRTFNYINIDFSVVAGKTYRI
jgi:hypothetical protein